MRWAALSGEIQIRTVCEQCLMLLVFYSVFCNENQNYIKTPSHCLDRGEHYGAWENPGVRETPRNPQE